MDKKTIVINFTGGPGAGKSFMATRLVSILKENGVCCEYVPEFAKDLVWDGRLSELNDQLYILANQFHMLSRLKNKVNVIITDSPIILSMYYNEQSKCFSKDIFTSLVLASYQNFDNIVYYVVRNHPYEREGRYQTEEESNQVSLNIKKTLDESGISYQTVVSSGAKAEEIAKFIIRLMALYGQAKDNVEYERKFLLKDRKILKINLSSMHICQSYLDIGQTEKRIRKVDNKRFFFTEKDGLGNNRREREKEISREEYEYFISHFAKGKPIEKYRTVVNLDGTKSCEINTFVSPKPINLIEVEFDSERAMQTFIPPKWFGREVTSEENYYNYNIALNKDN